MRRPREAKTCAGLLVALLLAGCGVDRHGLTGSGSVTTSPPAGGETPTGPVTPNQPPPPITPPPIVVEDAGVPADAAPSPTPVSPPPPASAPDAAPLPGTGSADAAPAPAPDAAPSVPAPDPCTTGARLPVNFKVGRAPSSNDLTFDDQGFLIMASGRDITRMSNGGDPQMVIANALQGNRTIDGLIILPGGDLVVSDSQSDALVVLDPQGQRRRSENLNSPSRVLRAPGGSLYVSSTNGELFLVDPNSGQSNVLARTDRRLLGLALSVDYRTLYVSDNRNGVLLSAAVHPDGTIDALQVFARNLGQGPDGLATDVCGNIYVADDWGGPLLRVSPNANVQVVSDVNRDPLSAVAFGSGRQGWDAHTLYAVSLDRGGIYQFPVGLAGAPPPP